MSAWPNLFVVGAQKAGTTSLWRALDRHPDVFMSRPKEPRYFSEYMRGFWPSVSDRDEYLALFDAGVDARYRGEASTSYLADPNTPERIRQSVGDAHIIISLRDPVQRAYSAYLHQLRNGIAKKPFLEAVEGEVDGRSTPKVSLLLHGRYAEALRRYIETFERRNVHVLFFEQLVAEPTTELRRLYAWLELSSVEQALTLGSENSFGTPRNAVAARILMTPELRRAAQRVLPRKLRSRGERLLLRRGSKPEIDSRAQALLEQYYADDRRAIEELVGPAPWPAAA